MSTHDNWQLQDSTGHPLENSALVEAMKNVSLDDTPESCARLHGSLRLYTFDELDHDDRYPALFGSSRRNVGA